MAVTVSGADHGYELAKLFGVPPELREEAKASGVQISHNIGMLVIATNAGLAVATVPLKGTAITLAQQGKMGPTSKEGIKFSVIQGIKKAIEKGDKVSVKDLFDGGYATEVEPGPGPSYKGGNIFKKMINPQPKTYPKPGMSAAEKAAWTKKQQKIAGGTVVIPDTPLSPEVASSPPKATIFLKTPVSLASATELYQPVHGTSKTYYVVAFLKGGTKLAARVAGDSLAMRAEGPGLHEYLSDLGSVGFDAKGNYASVHLSCGQVGIKKTYGAVLGAIGFSNVTSCASIESLP